MKSLPYRGAEDLSPEQFLAVRRTAAHELSRRGLIGVLVYPAFILVLALATPLGSEHPLVTYGALTITTAACVLRGLMFLYFDRLYDRNRKSWLLAYSLSIWVTGLTTGVLGGTAVYYYDISWAALVVTLMIAGIGAGALTSMCMSLNTLRVYLVFMLLPPILGSLTLEGGRALPMAFAFMAFLAYTLLQARNMGREYWESLINSIRLNAETKRQLHALTYHDPLTGLPNRGLFQDRLRQAVLDAKRRGHLVCIMSLGLDRFKNVNDTLGHHAGDLLLKSIAGRLQEALREGDTISRLSGDTFALICPMATDSRHAALVAHKLLEQLEPPFVIEGLELFVAASVGITVYPQDTTNPEQLLKNAEAAMFRIKEQGGSGYEYYKADINTQAAERLKLESRLRPALERDEYLLHYQPKVELAAGRLVGFEALLRWCPQGSSPVPPNQFIPILEDTGLIAPVGEWVLRAACRQNKLWQDSGLPPITMAVNLSARQFRDPGLADLVERVLKAIGLEARWLELEITESMLMDHTPETAVTLQRLSAMGVKLSIDDFGTGYSSLAYLKRLPISVLKIDRAFVKDITSDANDRAVVQAVIAMAHNLNLRVVAEGAETPEQVSFLRTQDCDEMQGFFTSRPVPAAEAQPILLDGHCRKIAGIASASPARPANLK